MFIGLHVKYPLLLSDVNETGIFFHRYSRNLRILNFIKKNRPVGAKLLHADGQTDR